MSLYTIFSKGQRLWRARASISASADKKLVLRRKTVKSRLTILDNLRGFQQRLLCSKANLKVFTWFMSNFLTQNYRKEFLNLPFFSLSFLMLFERKIGTIFFPGQGSKHKHAGRVLHLTMRPSLSYKWKLVE